MTPEANQYPTQSEKRRDFIIGAVIFFLGNILLSLINLLPIWLATTFTQANEVFAYIAAAVMCLPWVVNLGALLYFLIKRRWIAFGMLAAFGVVLLCVLLAGIVFAGICFLSIGQGN